MSPASDTIAGGAIVIISGINFTGANCPGDVTFGGTAADSCTVDDDDQITATVPAHGAGTVNVQVENNEAAGISDATAADQFIYVNGPAITP